jgi:hypothetical protein
MGLYGALSAWANQGHKIGAAGRVDDFDTKLGAYKK